MSLDPQLDTSTDPTAGENAGSDGEQQPTPQEPAQPEAATQAPTRTYSQDEFDRYKRSLRENMEREFRERYGAQSTRQPQSQPEGGSAPDPRLDRLEMRFAEQSVAKKYADFEKNSNAIYKVAADHGLGFILASDPSKSYEDILDMAYWYWKRDQMPTDLDAFKKQVSQQAIKDYVAKKETAASEAPSPEGTGGGAPTAPGRDFSKMDWDDVGAAAAALIKSRRAT